jgi:hypothetical protein
VQLDLHTQIILSVLSVYQSANKGICNNATRWKLKTEKKVEKMCVLVSLYGTARLLHLQATATVSSVSGTGHMTNVCDIRSLRIAHSLGATFG